MGTLKKTILGGVLTLGLTTFCLANVYVDWAAGGGFYFSGSGQPIFAIGSGDRALAQLIWSPDAVADGANFGTANYVSGNDVWLTDHIVTEGSYGFSEWAWFPSQIYNDLGANAPGGYIYARVFENDSPQLDDWYYTGQVVLAQNLNPLAQPPDNAQIYNVNRDSNNGDAIDGAFGAQVVPEPASISLLVLGAAVLGLRRRRR